MKITSPEDWSGLIQVLFCGALFGCVLLSGNYLFLEAQRDTLKASKQQEQERKATLELQYQQVNSLPLLQQQKQQFQQAIATLEQSYLSNDNMAALMREVSAVSQAHHLKLTLFKPTKQTPKQTTLYYQEHIVHLQLHGRYHDIGLFLTELGGITPLLSVATLQLRAQTKESSKNFHADETLLTLDAELISYRQRDKKEPDTARTTISP